MIKIFEAKKENLNSVLGFIESELESHECNIKTQMMITVIVEEIFVNIASYAYEDKVGEAIINLEFENDDVIIEFKDSGIEFNPLEKKDPDITLKAEDRDIGGLGIFMVKKTMDSVKYERKDGFNILTIRKGIH